MREICSNTAQLIVRAGRNEVFTVLVSFAFGMVLHLLRVPDAVLKTAAIISMSLFPGFRWKLLGLFSAIVAIFGTSIIDWPLVSQQIRDFGYGVDIADPVIRMFIFLFNLILLAGLTTALHRAPFSKAFKILTVFVLFVFLAWWIRGPRGSVALTCAVLLIHVVGRYFFRVAIALLEWRPGENLWNWKNFSYLLPFWTWGLHSPVPLGRNALVSSEARDANEAVSGRKNGMVLLLLTLLLDVSFRVLMTVIGQQRYLFGYDISIIRITDLSLMNRWVQGTDFFRISFASGFFFLFDLACYLISFAVIKYNIIVATANMAGFLLPGNVDSPWRATSFHDFLGRWFRYYNAVLLEFVIEPVFRRVDRSSIRREFKLLSLFCGVFIAGIVYHLFTNFIQYFYLMSFSILLINLANMTPYFFLLAMAITTSYEWGSRKRTGKIAQVLWLVFYFCIFAAIFGFAVGKRNHAVYIG